MMEPIDLENLILSLLGNSAKPVSGKELIEASEHYSGRISGMVFLPTGDGYLMLDEENNQNERNDTK